MKIDKFWSNVDIKYGDDWWRCWEWKLSKNDGYGHLHYNGKATRSHRIAYQLTHANENIEGKYVLHKCDNTSCCNPFHLELGDHQLNMKQRRERNRTACGEKQGSSKLTKEDVLYIKNVYKNHILSQRKIAKKFGVSRTTICDILHSKRYKNIDNPEDIIEKIDNIKLNVNDAKKILELFKDGWTKVDIAKKFNVSRTPIYKIIAGTWERKDNNQNYNNHHIRKLTKENVLEIQDFLRNKKSIRSIAKKFNISMSSIRRIQKGEIYKDWI